MAESSAGHGHWGREEPRSPEEYNRYSRPLRWSVQNNPEVHNTRYNMLTQLRQDISEGYPGFMAGFMSGSTKRITLPCTIWVLTLACTLCFTLHAPRSCNAVLTPMIPLAMRAHALQHAYTQSCLSCLDAQHGRTTLHCLLAT